MTNRIGQKFCEVCMDRLLDGERIRDNVGEEVRHCEGCGESIFWIYTLVCDQCALERRIHATTIDHAITIAEENGWHLLECDQEHEAVCPACLAKAN